MTDEELESAYSESKLRWESANTDNYNNRLARYFFFDGAVFGTQQAAALYEQANETLKQTLAEL